MNEKKNVLIVHNCYQIPGGEDTVVKNEKLMLETYGNNVILYTRNNNELKKNEYIKKIILPFITIFNIRTYFEIKHLIENENIDIVHVHNTLNLISPSVYYAAVSCGVPVVQTIHNFRLLCPAATFYRDGHICEDCLKKGLRCAVIHGCYRNNRFETLACVINTKLHRMTGIYKKINFICLTEFNKGKILELKQIRKNKVFVKPNFVDNKKEIILNEKRKNQFVFVGRLDKLKGIDLLFKTWKQTEDGTGKLIVCGTGPMEEWCKKFVDENKINVELKGFIPNEEVRKIIAVSRALIFPTQWYEGFPMNIIEAYSVGTPVLGSNIGNTKNIIKEGITGMLFDDISELPNIIRKLSFNMKIYESTYRYYLEHYTMQVNFKKLKKIYEKVEDNRS